MLGNCERMAVFASTTNEWPQNQIDEKSFMASRSKLIMEKQGQELSGQSQQQESLKCPRCDSSNTKFCYYNNYSLSQPRHFCKACKRYWTRGGTLRNVPVGGGCRKNKRVKRPSASAIDGAPSVSSANPNPPSQTQIDIYSSTSNHVNPLFYALPNQPTEMNLPFPSRFNSSVSSNIDSTVSRYDLHPQLNALAIEFSSNGLKPTNKPIQDVATSNSLLSNYSIFGSSTSTSTTSPTIATLLASSLQQQKFVNGCINDTRGASNHFQNITPFEDQKMSGNSESGISVKQVKVERGQNGMDWSVSCQNQIDQISFSDPSLYWNTPASVVAWHDPANIGSSLASLI